MCKQIFRVVRTDRWPQLTGHACLIVCLFVLTYTLFARWYCKELLALLWFITSISPYLLTRECAVNLSAHIADRADTIQFANVQ